MGVYSTEAPPRVAYLNSNFNADNPKSGYLQTILNTYSAIWISSKFVGGTMSSDTHLCFRKYAKIKLSL